MLLENYKNRKVLRRIFIELQELGSSGGEAGTERQAVIKKKKKKGSEYQMFFQP